MSDESAYSEEEKILSTGQSTLFFRPSVCYEVTRERRMCGQMCLAAGHCQCSSCNCCSACSAACGDCPAFMNKSANGELARLLDLGT